MKKFFLLFCTCLFLSGLQAQTKRIAHLSHSGALSALDFTLGDNFGVFYMPEITDSFVRLDSFRVISITKNADNQSEIWRDTLQNPPHIEDPLRFMDSVKRQQFEQKGLQRRLRTTFIGFGTDAEAPPAASAPACTLPPAAPAEVVPMLAEPDAPESKLIKFTWLLALGGVFLAILIWIQTKGKI